MNRKKIRTTLCALLALAGLTAIASTASGGAGSQADPLVTLSYLTETFTGQVMERVDERIVQRNAALSAELGGAYAAVTLSAGQTLYGEAGCEVLLRSPSEKPLVPDDGQPCGDRRLRRRAAGAGRLYDPIKMDGPCPLPQRAPQKGAGV